jgi:uncharacterized protein (DUF2126 family)
VTPEESDGRTNAISSSSWESFCQESIACLYSISIPEPPNFHPIQLHYYELEKRHVERPEAWGFTNGRIDTNMEKVDTTERLTQLRELMKKHKVDIYSM